MPVCVAELGKNWARTPADSYAGHRQTVNFDQVRHPGSDAVVRMNQVMACELVATVMADRATESHTSVRVTALALVLRRGGGGCVDGVGDVGGLDVPVTACATWMAHEDRVDRWRPRVPVVAPTLPALA